MDQMKIVLMILAFLTAVICQAQSAGGSGGGERFRPVSLSVGCKDGDRSFFTESLPNDRSRQVLRTCENGRYYPKSAPVILPCRDGQRVKMQDMDPRTYRLVEVVRVCKGGRYYQERKSMIRSTRY
jgi:hypothetical protein